MQEDVEGHGKAKRGEGQTLRRSDVGRAVERGEFIGRGAHSGPGPGYSTGASPGSSARLEFLDHGVGLRALRARLVVRQRGTAAPGMKWDDAATH